MKDYYHKQLMQWILMSVGTITFIVVCVIFNYFIIKQQNELEVLRKERLLKEAELILLDKNNQM